jgi:hypothetical protein
MMHNDSERAQPHATTEAAEAVLLLPWYAAGTLSDRDRRKVEDVLRQYPSLADQVDLTQEELTETIHLNESLGAPSARVAERLMAAIDAEPRAARFKMSGATTSWFTNFFAGLSPRTLATGASLAVLVIVAQGAMLADNFAKPQQAAVPAPAAAPAPVYRGLEVGSFARVRFAHDANAGDITSFLQNYRAAVVDGPTSNGLYRLRVAPGSLARSEVAGIVRRMRDEKVVEFADVD